MKKKMLKKEGLSTTKCNYQQSYMIYKSLRRQIRIYSYFSFICILQRFN